MPTEAFDEREVASEAMTAAAELKRQAATHRELGIALDRIERENKRKLDSAVQALAREHAQDEQALHLLTETRREIGQIIPALMLLPDTNLFDDLIRNLEGSGEVDLLKRLYVLRDDVVRMNPADETAWKHISRQIRQLSGDTPISTH
ncbi:MAG: hypothetical protein HC869_13495 [Rhodospirillales bacterium]|nr:hypothetical protein [Rhodospirillales bacterium]